MTMRRTKERYRLQLHARFENVNTTRKKPIYCHRLGGREETTVYLFIGKKTKKLGGLHDKEMLKNVEFFFLPFMHILVIIGKHYMG